MRGKWRNEEQKRERTETSQPVGGTREREEDRDERRNEGGRAKVEKRKATAKVQ